MALSISTNISTYANIGIIITKQNQKKIYFTNMEDILTRISKIAELEGITITAMEKSIGASKGVLSRALKNKSDIQSKWIQIIVEKYPTYNSEWLLTGKGEASKNPDKLRISEIYQVIEDRIDILSEAPNDYESLKKANAALFLESLKAKDELIETLRDNLKEKDALIETFKSGKIVYVGEDAKDKK